MGNDSPYNVFFNLPYPLFELTIKGYFGKSVTYCLHLVKFEGKLNEGSGNFEIKCEFIGYTYAFLSDMLMGLLRGVVEIPRAKTYVEEAKKNSLSRPNSNKQLKNPTFLPFNELNERVKQISKEINELKYDDKDVARLTLAESVIFDLREQSNNIKLFLNKLSGLKENDGQTPKTIEVLNTGKFAIIKTPSSENLVKLLNTRITEFNDKLKKDIELLNDRIGDTNPRYSLDKNIFKVNDTNKTDRVRKVDFLNENYNIISSTSVNTSYITNDGELIEDVIVNGTTLDISNLKSEDKKYRVLPYITQFQNEDQITENDYYQEFRRDLENKELDKVGYFNELIIFDFDKMFIELLRVENNIKTDIKKTKEIVSDKLLARIEGDNGLGFTPSIRNMVGILTEHVHILMKCIRDVANEVKLNMDGDKGNNTRARNLSSISSLYADGFDVSSGGKEARCGNSEKSGEEDDELGNVHPFPDYKELDESGAYVDKWIGNVAPKIPEVLFIEQLVDGLLNAKKDDSDRDDTLANGEPEWYPINPFDTKLLNGYKNPWSEFREINSSDDVIRHMLLRMTTFLGYSHTKLNKEEIKTMARLEANNAFNNIGNVDLRNSIALYGKSRDSESFLDEINRVSISEGNPAWVNNAEFYNETKMFKSILAPSDDKSFSILGLFFPDNKRYDEYQYVTLLNEDTVSTSSTTNNQYFIPLSTNVTNDTNYYNGNSLMTNSSTGGLLTNQERVALRNSGKIFFGSLLGGNSLFDYKSKPDDGSSTIKIISKEKYNLEQNEYPELPEDIFSNISYTESLLKFEDPEDIQDDGFYNYNGMFGGKWKTHEIRNIIIDSDEIDSSSNEEVPSWIRFFANTGHRHFFSSINNKKTSTDFNIILNNETVSGTFPNQSSKVMSPQKTTQDQNIIDLNLNNKSNVIAPCQFIKDQNSRYESKIDSDKNLKNLLLLSKEGSNSVSLPYLSFNTEKSKSQDKDTDFRTEYSLFGSDLYHAQTDVKSKAFLFLHSLPWDGMVDKDKEATNWEGGLFTDNIKTFFDQRSAFIEVPKYWIYMVGAILWRYQSEEEPIIWTKKDNNNNEYNLIPNNVNPPDKDEYLISINNSQFGSQGMTFNNMIANYDPSFANLGNSTETNNKEVTSIKSRYLKLERTIRYMPQALINEFLNEFDKFTSGNTEFNTIRNKYDIFYNNGNETSYDEKIELWLDWNQNLLTEPNTLFNNINSNIKENYLIVSRDDKYSYTFLGNGTDYNNKLYKQLEEVRKGNNLNGKTRVQAAKDVVKNYAEMTNTFNIGSPFNFFLEMRSNTGANKFLLDEISKTKIIASSSRRLWASNAEYEKPEDTVTANFPFRWDENNKDEYINSFYTEYKKLVDEKGELDNDDDEKNKIFNTLDSDDIKLQLYKTIKSIYDKWVPGSRCELELCAGVSEGGDSKPCPNLLDTFRFIDRAYRDIGDELKVNPIDAIKSMTNDYNISMYDYLAKLLTDNKFDFIPLPTYIDYSTDDEFKEAFKPQPFTDMESSGGPTFICMYSGERAKHLNLGSNSQHKDDGFNFSNGESECLLPSDFGSDGNNPNLKQIPAFKVQYGDENQSMFKSVKVSQAEFTETEESLKIIDDLSKESIGNVGQNLYNIYRTRAYSCTVEMLGDAQIQPFMYFQLDNIPMFTGAYNIINVKHTIKPNHMSTTFKGVKVRRNKTELIKKSALLMNMLGSLENLNLDNVTLDGLGEDNKLEGSSLTDFGIPNNVGAPEWAGCIIYEINDNKGLISQKPTTAKVTKGNVSKYVTPFTFKEIGSFIEGTGRDWNKYVTENGLDISPTIYYNDFSMKGGGNHPGHKTHANGKSMDFRAIVKNASKLGDLKYIGTNRKDPNYDLENTIKLVEMMLDKSKDYVGFDNGVIFELLYNDPNVIKHFENYYGDGRNLVRAVGGHDDHFHVNFNLPTRISSDEVNGYETCKEDLAIPYSSGHITDIPPILKSLGYTENDIIYQLTYALAKKEGYGNPDEKVIPRRNFNPGNLTGIDEFKSIDPNVSIGINRNGTPDKTSPFAKFSNSTTGTQALINKITNWANGKFPTTVTNGCGKSAKEYQDKYNVPQSVRGIGCKTPKEPMTLEQFIYTYAPPSENKSDVYLRQIITMLNKTLTPIPPLTEITKDILIKDYVVNNSVLNKNILNNNLNIDNLFNS